MAWYIYHFYNFNLKWISIIRFYLWIIIFIKILGWKSNLKTWWPKSSILALANLPETFKINISASIMPKRITWKIFSPARRLLSMDSTPLCVWFEYKCSPKKMILSMSIKMISSVCVLCLEKWKRQNFNHKLSFLWSIPVFWKPFLHKEHSIKWRFQIRMIIYRWKFAKQTTSRSVSKIIFTNNL